MNLFLSGFISSLPQLAWEKCYVVVVVVVVVWTGGQKYSIKTSTYLTDLQYLTGQISCPYLWQTDVYVYLFTLSLGSWSMFHQLYFCMPISNATIDTCNSYMMVTYRKFISNNSRELDTAIELRKDTRDFL